MQKVSSLLWTKCRDLALASAIHPFIISLLRGTLHEAAFKSYIGQDAFYLRSFKNAYGRAAEICDRNGDKNFKIFQDLGSGVDTELLLHAEYSKTLNINLANISPLPQTALYTEFLDNTGSKSIAQICAAMTPCMALYAFIGRRGMQNGYRPGAYSRWLEEYSSDSFQQLSKTLEDLLDHYAESEQYQFSELLPIYLKAMELELAFFAAHEVKSWNGVCPRLLCVDFDMTLTEHDSITLLVSNALKIQNRDLAVFKELEQVYFTRLNAVTEKLLSTSCPTFKMTSFKTMISMLSEFDKSMITPVEESLILKGLSLRKLENLGSLEVTLQHDAKHWINFALRRQSVNIITLNWSETLVANALKCCIPHSPEIRRPSIFGNELVVDSEGVSTGNLIQKMNTAEDKENCIRQLQDELESKCISEVKLNWKNAVETGPFSGPDVYIGDSIADLAAMLTVDIGIVINPRPSFHRLCAAYGITLQPLENIVSCNGKRKNYAHLQRCSGTSDDDMTNTEEAPAPVIYVGESWAHIGFCLFGKHYLSEWTAVLHRGGEDSYYPSTQRAIASSADTDGDSSEVRQKTGILLPRVISVAGSDSGGGAGIQADLKTFDALGVFGTTAITALTSQNTVGVSAVSLVEPAHVRSQLDSVLSDIGTDSLKTGMLATEACASEVARAAIDGCIPNFVLDPVMVTTSGTRLMSESAVDGIRRMLFPLALIVTPNLEEVSALLGCERIRSVADMEVAAEQLFAMGPGYVLVKGGHLPTTTPTAPDAAAGLGVGESTQEVVDVLYDGTTFEHIRHPIIHTPNTHGTGCTLASAIAAHLAKGHDVPSAVRSARAYLHDVLQRSASLRIGQGRNGPLFHMAHVFPQALSDVSGKSIQGSQWKKNVKSFNLSAYLVTDPTLNARHGRTMEEVVAAAVAGGASAIQLREKKSSTAEFTDAARRALAITRAAGVPLFINDRIDVALAVGADGVHLGQDDLSVRDARRILGDRFIIGVSTRSVEEALEADRQGADYLGVGAVYPTSTKTDTKHIGLSQLRLIANSVDIPVVAIGGIGLGQQVKDALHHGARGVAVVSAVFGADDITEATKMLVNDIAEYYSECDDK